MIEMFIEKFIQILIGDLVIVLIIVIAYSIRQDALMMKEVKEERAKMIHVVNDSNGDTLWVNKEEFYNPHRFWEENGWREITPDEIKRKKNEKT